MISGRRNIILTAGEDVYAELDGGEVTAADLIAQLVESDSLAECYLTQASLVAGQLIRQSLVGRQEALALRLQQPPIKWFEQRRLRQAVAEFVVAVQVDNSVFIAFVTSVERLRRRRRRRRRRISADVNH